MEQTTPTHEPTVGELVRHYRAHGKLTRQVVADEIDRSKGWLSQVEQEKLAVNDIHLLGRLSTVLGAPLDEFVRAALGPDAPEVPKRPYVEVLRQSLAGHPVPGTFAPGGPGAVGPIALPSLRERTATAWQLVHGSNYRRLGPHLAQLIGDLEAASRVPKRRSRHELLSLLANAYQVAAAMLVKEGDQGAGWVAADRAIAVGERCEERELVLAGQLRMAWTLLGSKEQALARHVLTRGIAMATDATGSQDPGLISLVGACALLLGVVEAREGNTKAARRNLHVARGLANALGSDQNYHGTEFGPTNVQLHAVAIEVELGNGGEAIELSKRVNASALSLERQSRYLVDVARAHLLAHRPSEALTILLRAEQIAPEELADLALVVTVIDDIERHIGRPRPALLTHLKRRLYG